MSDLVKIDDATYVLEDQFVRCFLLLGNESALWIDSGVSNPDLEELADAVTSLPLSVVYTHGDGDHISGTAQFSQFMMTKEDYEGCGVAEKFPNSQWIEICDGDVIDLGGRTLEVISVPGHTAGSIALLDRERRILYAGDTLQKEHIYLFGAHRKPEQFTHALEKLISRKADYNTVLASHGLMKLEANAAEQILADWKKVQAGTIPAKEVDMWGQKVKSYDGAYCGFYLQ